MKYNTARKAIIRARRRKILMAALDDECARCSRTDDLQFDHINRLEKSFTISDGLDKPWLQLIAEIMKCQLLCSPCHLEKSLEQGDLRNVQHGGGLTGKRGCFCETCGPLKQEYMRVYMRQKRKSKLH